MHFEELMECFCSTHINTFFWLIREYFNFLLTLRLTPLPCILQPCVYMPYKERGRERPLRNSAIPWDRKGGEIWCVFETRDIFLVTKSQDWWISWSIHHHSIQNQIHLCSPTIRMQRATLQELSKYKQSFNKQKFQLSARKYKKINLIQKN